MNVLRNVIRVFLLAGLLFVLAGTLSLPVSASSINWAQGEAALGIKNCTINNDGLSSIKVQALSLNATKLTLRAGQATRLIPEITPENAANQTVKWKSDKKSVAAVSANGYVTAKKAGSCTITAWTADGKKKATCSVTVKKASSSTKPITLSKSSMALKTGQTKQLTATLQTPLASTPLSWASSNTQVARVDQYGRVTALRTGTATISGRANATGSIASCKVTVSKQYGISKLKWTLQQASASTAYSAQGSGINHGTYFKLWFYNTVQLYDAKSGSLQAEFPLDVRHGNIIDFDTASGTHGGSYDDAYVTCETNPAMVNVYRFTKQGATRLRSYVFPLSKTGYNAGHTLDPKKQRLYLVGYKKDSFYNANNNQMIVSVWDISKSTKLRDGFYQPKFIKSFTLPFILTLQGQCLHNGKLYILSSHWINPKTEIYVVDLSKGTVSKRITYLPTEIKHIEMESLFFVGETLYLDKNSTIYKLKLT